MQISKEDIVSVLQVCLAVGDAIRDLSAASPLGGVPSGELYAHLMGKMSIGTYDSIIRSLKAAKCVEEKGHLLVWIGPAKKA